MTKSLRMQIWSLHYEGYYTHEIADALDISEWMVIQVLQPAGY